MSDICDRHDPAEAAWRPPVRRAAAAAFALGVFALMAATSGCSSGGGSDDAAEDQAFALLEESHELRAAGDFASAQARLEEALELAEPGSDAESSIRDELRYSLPLAWARRALREGDPEDIDAILAPAREYIRDHPDRFARAREIAELLDETGPGSTSEDDRRSFALLEESHALKARSDFDGAAERLNRALSLAEPGSDAEDSVRDELFYYLPVARARQALAQHDAAAVERSLTPVHEYLEDHPRRFERAREVESLAEAARFLRQAIAVDARSRLHSVRVMLTSHFLELGECPRDADELVHLVQQSGVKLPASFEVEDLVRGSESCTARFRSTESGESEELSWP